MVNTPKQKARVAWLSPLPPQKSGIANYSYWLVRELRHFIDVDLYCDAEEVLLDLRDEFDIYPLSAFPKRHEHYGEVFYHLGNNSEFHKDIYKLAWDFPGTVVLHDYNISAFMHDAFYLQADWRLYEAAFVDANGDSQRKGFQGLIHLLNRNVGTHPMSQAVVNRSKRVVVHHQWVRNQFPKREHIEVIPHFARTNYQPTVEEIQNFKRKFQIKESDFVISCFGFINKNKLPDLQVTVARRLLAQGYPVHLLFAGETAPDLHSLQNEVQASEHRENITFTGYLDEPEYFSAIFASDVAINLRKPSMGEASGTLMHSLAAGRPTIVSDSNQYLEFPDRVCWKVTHDEKEADILHAYLTVLLSNKNVRAALSENSINYVKNVFALDKVIPQWVRLIA